MYHRRGLYGLADLVAARYNTGKTDRNSFGPLAHAWLEQRTHNPLVPCSTHGGPTKKCSKIKGLREIATLFSLPKVLAHLLHATLQD